jgi:hypothetical protein
VDIYAKAVASQLGSDGWTRQLSLAWLEQALMHARIVDFAGILMHMPSMTCSDNDGLVDGAQRTGHACAGPTPRKRRLKSRPISCSEEFTTSDHYYPRVLQLSEITRGGTLNVD